MGMPNQHSMTGELLKFQWITSVYAILGRSILSRSRIVQPGMVRLDGCIAPQGRDVALHLNSQDILVAWCRSRAELKRCRPVLEVTKVSPPGAVSPWSILSAPRTFPWMECSALVPPSRGADPAINLAGFRRAPRALGSAIWSGRARRGNAQMTIKVQVCLCLCRAGRYSNRNANKASVGQI
jgi:hypothetical protein